MIENAHAKVLDAIYNAAVSTDGWQNALDGMGQIFGCNISTIISRNLHTMNGTAVSVGIDEAGQREYFEVWGRRNVFVEKTLCWQPGSIVTDQQILPKSELLKSDYYNGFLKPRDMHSLLRISLQIEQHVHQSISLMRPRSLGEFEQRDLEHARLFLPHLQRAARLSKHLSVSDAMLRAANSLLEENPTGVILIGGTGKVIFANRAVRKMACLADSFTLRNDQIEPLHADENLKLRRLITGASGINPKINAARGGVMRLKRESSSLKADYVAVVGPLSQNSIYSEAPAAFILMTDLEASPKSRGAVLQNLFGLTFAEANLAEALGAGNTPDQAAAILNVKISTVRSQLGEVLRKTGTSRQSQLIRFLLLLPSDGEK